MSGAEVVGLVASIVSLIIGGFAIWLSVTFYKMSTKSSKELEQASANIDSTVNRLEVLFDKLYADTFSMMKDTVTDMRNHVWKTASTESSDSRAELDESLVQLKAELNQQIEQLILSQGKANEKVDSFAKQVEALVSDTIDKSAMKKATKSALEKADLVVSVLKQHGGLNEAQLQKLTGLSELDLTQTIFDLGSKKIIEWEEGPGKYSTSSIFTVTK
ncbi:hypothetical protein [Vibrio parahaemolyticus]|uniref:hypothetical protein n=1 Tax=Vibrio parahaemolyticus TaxID=670 RepID=UPI0008130987|nr:hypothetical protein [Vibrio parahaemolyticus]ELB2229824.1 hypothetical protein [Vibrio parahaemolyticus]OCP52565.1 hypothetical protein AKH04_22695 [Vibrio parahaemolyticus]